MNFTSPAFLLYFLPFLLIIYLAIPQKFKNVILIVASAVFYFWGEGNYLLYLYVWVVVNYLTSKIIYKSKKNSGSYLALAILINLGILLYFKYTNFIIVNLNYLGFINLKELKIHLPLALSFFAFHAISYNIDTYRKVVKPESSLARLTLYFTFFPHLIAGPIIRYHQIKAALLKRSFSSSMMAQGLSRFIIGLAKKVVIANTLAPIVDEIFGIGPGHVSLDQAWLGAVCFGLQIYYDFSGYTDMAIGLGLMFGFKFPENFNYPYISISITEFWKRWHMTLSAWLKDYLYYPLALKWGRTSKVRLYFCLFITFVLIGLWHGANWTFVVFGAIQGIALIIESIRGGILIRWMPTVIRHGYFLLVMSVSWVFFRSSDLTEAFHFLKLMFKNNNPQDIYYSTNYFLRSDIIIVIIIGIIFATPIPEKFFRLIRTQTIIKTVNLLAFVGLFILCLIFIASETYQSFIYFRF